MFTDDALVVMEPFPVNLLHQPSPHFRKSWLSCCTLSRPLKIHLIVDPFEERLQDFRRVHAVVVDLEAVLDPVNKQRPL